MDELQGENKDAAQDSVDELLISSACVDHFETIDSPQPIINGLQLIEKCAVSQRPFKCFSYATSPITQEPVTVEKTIIWHRAYPIQSEHVRCHMLTPDDNIAELSVRYSKQDAQAVVLINTANNYSLISHSLLREAACSDIPVLVVTSQDGEQLLSILNAYKPGDVFVQILQKDSEFSSQLSSTALHRVKASSKLHLSRGVVFNPWKEFKLYAFPKEGPVCVCRDIVKFQLVMCTFNQFEYEAKSQHEAQGKQPSEFLLKKMNKKLEKYKNNPVVFEENFPLYVLLSFHMHRRRDIYQCGELEKFIETVLERMESLPIERVAEVLNGFLEQDFNIMKGEEKISTFHNLYEACEGILVLRFDKKHKRSIYCWILWITVLLRCYQCDLSVSSDEVPSAAERLWNNYILKESSSITLKKETIRHIGKGVKLGVLLLLPDELQFNASRMSSLLFPHNLIRPLQHVRNFMFEIIQNQEQLLQNEEQFVSSFVRTSRDHYACLFHEHGSALKFSDASVDHSVAGFVGEGVDFLDTVWHVSVQRHWKSGALQVQCRKWFSLLLKAVKIEKGVESILKIFLGSDKPICWVADFRPHIQSEIIKKTREMYGKMKISVFYPMYKAFYIWSNDFLSEYLKSYDSSDCDLTDVHWALLFKEVVQRFPDPNKHGFILDFLSSKAPIYAEIKQPVKYILHVMKLDVPNLFTGLQSNTSVPAEKFKEHLHSYIASNGLQRELLKNVDVIMNGIHQHPHGFQDHILSVLQKDIIPYLQTSAQERQLAWKHLNPVISVLCKKVCPEGNLTRKERFCWGVLSTLCEQIQPEENCFDWAEVFTTIIDKMGEIYGHYCLKWHSKLGTKECTLEKQLKPDICKCPPEVKVYYLWIQKIHMILSSWHSKFMLTQTVNYDDMINYASCNTIIYKVAKAVCATQLIVDDQDISKLKTTYLEHFEELNFRLLKYVPEVPRAKWQILMSILKMYGVGLPENLQELMEQFVAFPGENFDSEKLTPQRHPLPPNISGKFKPPQPISLSVSERLTWEELATFLQELKEFLKPLDNCMDVLVFFTLHDSKLFSAYLRHEMETRDADLNADLNVFAQAFNQVMSLLVKLCHGEAKYDEITANGAVNLETLDIESEYSILLTSVQFRKLPGISNTQGLDGVKNMVELLKVSSHIRMFRQVCQQYHLQTCLDDENLKNLTVIVDGLMDEKARASLTPLSATDKMKNVRELLGAKGGVGTHEYEYLAIFSKIADSAEFYQFICEKGFTGEDGQARFHQQYELITAQLQHEEYDEAVLNLLYTAYKLLLPFTVEDQTFHSLLDSVKQMLTTASPVDTAKEISDHLRKIETVNRNIHLVRLWFARAEGDTIQNVANDLARVFKTGCYRFNIPENVADLGELELKYKPSSKRTLLESPNEEKSIVFDEEETWDSEQIDGFARKLGFLDSKKADGEMVKSFLHVNEIANKILDFLVELRELGYPSHLTDVARNGLKCNEKEADQIVKQMEDKMDGWSQDLDRLLLKHHWLLLFSLPKLLKLSKLLISAFQPDFDAKEIMHELGFLFRSEVKARKQVMGPIKDSLSTLQIGRCRFDQNEANIPFGVCGTFLDALFKDPELTVYSPRNHSDESCLTHSVHTRQPTLCSTHSIEILHSAPDFSQGELISVIVSIYNGRLPHPFEFFRCHENSTMHQLKLFITRANSHPLTFIVLGVNVLPIKLQEMLLRQHVDFHSSSDHEIQPCVHYVETFPSILQEMPWIYHQKHKLSDVMKLEDVQKICHQQAVVERGIACIQLVYGAAGIGKTYYIRKQLANCCSVTVAVNEGFEPIQAIQRLNVLPRTEKNCAIFFNFNLIPPVGDSVREEDKKHYANLMETISWFFFDLLFLGYVEDPHSGESFQLSGGLSWSIYVEGTGTRSEDGEVVFARLEVGNARDHYAVAIQIWKIYHERFAFTKKGRTIKIEGKVPSRNLSSNADVFLKEFCSEIPIFKLLGTPKQVESTAQYSDVSDPDVQLVCKYLKVYDSEIGGVKRINKLYKEDKKKKSNPVVKFSTEAALPSKECEHLLMKYVPASIRQVKTSQLLFLSYMRRRCWFLDNFPAYNYNTGVGIKTESGEMTDTRHLGSTLFEAMIKEAEQFCQPCYNEDQQFCQPRVDQIREYHQLIYDVQDGGGSIGLISTTPQDFPHLKRVGVHIPTMLELHNREFLDKCISRALNIPLENERLTAIDEENYVLTLDFTIKMLQIHERYECGEPVILQGETGVGKTALIQMLSKLWNVSLDMELKRLKGRVLEFLRSKLKFGSDMATDQYGAWLKAIDSIIKEGKNSIEEEDLMFIAILPFPNSSGYLHQEMKEYLKKVVRDPLLPLLKTSYQDLDILLKEAIADTGDLTGFSEQHAKPVVEVFHGLLTASVRSTFHKLNVHAAMKPDDLAKGLQSAFEQAHQLQKASKRTSTGFHRIPHITIFLDELNASTCGGLFKELIVDRMFQGEPIPKNIFIVAACNPHRGNSLAALTVANAGRLRGINDSSDETWIMDSYFVQKLHPTLAHLMWDYGSLDESQERQYVLSKVKMFCDHLSKTQKPARDQPSETQEHKGDQSSEAQQLKVDQPSETQEQKGDQSSEAQQLKADQPSETREPNGGQSSEAQQLKEGEQSETQEPKGQSSEAQQLKGGEQSETHKQKKDQPSETQKTKTVIESTMVADMIVFSQNLMRKYVFEELSTKIAEHEAKVSSKCCVSQRDIQRVFTFYEWTLKLYQKFDPHSDCDDFTSSLRAILVALGTVYYMRLNRKYRARYQHDFACKFSTVLQFSNAFQSELDWYTQQIELPKGIAKTQALKENLFAIITCCVTQTPLIIVGAPGSSKTLSFNIAVSNLRGQESKKKIFRKTDVFCSLDPHFYQCSRRTTSNEIRTVFSRAITRQKNIKQFSLPIKCVVFMDEAGLPERSHESLKILHSYLDNLEVSFVAISNTVLDAAKTNRAVTLFRDPMEISEDLEVLANECLFESPGCPPQNIREHVDTIVSLHSAYTETMTKLKLSRFFGLRDFIHFVQYIRHKCVQRGANLSLYQVGQLVTESLEKNFSGSQQFSAICEAFIQQMNVPTSKVRKRDAVVVLQDSLRDAPTIQDEVRYKIIIHSSEDDSLVRLLFQFKILERQNTRIYMCSDFPGDSELQKIDTIAGIRHSALEGHSIVMIQTDDIHESFYDLFNRRFKRIDDPVSGVRLYANIAIGAHLKPCRVDPKFQCVVAIKKSELDRAPAPFLNRFEKYYITHKDMYESVLKCLPVGFKLVVEAAYGKAKEFIQCSGGPSSFYGFCEETLDSLLLKVLPLKFTHTDVSESTHQPSLPVGNFENPQNQQIFIVQVLTEAVTVNFNFQSSTEEMECDAVHLVQLLLSSNPKFEGVLRTELLDMKMARRAVHSALHTLQSDRTDFPQLPPVTQLMQSLLVQWLVRHFCKRLMQLMTPEALVLHERQIPEAYIHNYLTYQKHFSLKDLIQQQLDRIAVQEKRSNTKLLCFTRTSPLIHNLPSVYPSTAHSTLENKTGETWLKNHLFHEVSQLLVCKIEGSQSQRSVRRMVKDFWGSAKDVMFLLVNMQEVSRYTVNHLRVMIEEEEATVATTLKPKLFLVLLHFPPAMFFTACYPSLFLEGWDHYYLDTIAHGLPHGIVNSVEWLHMSCFHTGQNPSTIKDTFFEMLKHLLPQSIPHVVSRLSFGSDHSRPFNQPMTPVARSEMLQKLFDTELGDTLCHHFRSYWKAEVMTEYLHRTVKFTQTGQMTLNITDSIHSIIKSHFLDFVVYMVDYLNDNYNLDILLHPESTDEVIQLFQDMAKCLPIPQKLSKLKLLSSIQHGSHCRKDITRKYIFPFFGVVCPQIMDTVKKVAHCLCQTEDIPEGKVNSQLSFEEQLQKQVEKVLKDHKGYVAVALTAISKHTTLWNRYFHDFTREQLTLWLHDQQVIEETLKATFGTVCTPSASNISQLTSLHVYAHLNQQNIMKTGAAIGPLVKLSSITEHLSHFSSSSSAILLNPKDMNTFVISTVFGALINNVKFQTSNTSVELWYNAYHMMIHSPAIHKRIYSALSATSEAKLNVMHAAFLAVQYDPSDNGLLMMCHDMVNRLCGEHFIMDSFELKGRCPQMPEMFETITELFDNAPRTDVHNSIVSFIADGLLTHFICYYDKPNKDNILWLLEHINEQKSWLMGLQHRTHGLTSWKSRSLSGGSEEVQSPLLSFHSDSHCLPLNALKYYLMRILGSFREENMRQLVPPYEPEGRAILGTFLSKRISNDVTGIYIPPFYKLPGVAMTENDLHSQPLAYLYFLTVLEYLLNQQSDLSGLLNVASKIYESRPDEMNEKILCSIEKQALVQVIIKELAKQLVPENYRAVACKLAILNKPLNALIDEQTSGENLDLHGYILAMYLLKETQSLEKFTRLLTKEYETHCADYKCLSVFRGMIKEIHLSRKNFYHLLLQVDQSSQLGRLHQQVQKLVIGIAGRQDKSKKLNDLARKSQRSQVSLSGSTESSDWMDRLPCVKMMIWLTVYHHIYNQQKSSAEMTDACSKLLPDFFDKPFCQLICWFASPKDRGTPGPLSELFGHSVTDPTDICLLHCLANLVACAIGTQEQARSSHLWYLVFAPEKLEGTYFAGYMNDGLVNAKRGKPYEEGVQLSKDGLSCFLQQSITSSLNLNSRCLLLWMNVASFCVSLLVQEGERLSGILSGRVPVEKYCISQLRNIWKLMKSNMQLTDEELSYLVMMCMRRYLQTWVASSDKVNGIFMSAGMVAQYEQLWHSDVFVPCLENLETEFMKNLEYPLKKLLVEIRQVEARYPHFPGGTAALYSVLSLPDVQAQSQDKLVVLSKFICKLPEIQISLPFFPDFLEFYQWLHKDLAGVLTPEKADKLSIKKLVDRLSKHYSGESGRKLRSLYQRVKCGYNCYTKDATGVTADGEFDKISVRHFLTLDASTLPGNSEGDILYSIIYYMATCHNELLDCVQTVASYSRETHMNRYIPEGIPSVTPTDFAEGACVVEKSGREKLQSDFLQLVSRRHHFSTAAQNWSQQVVTNPHFLVLEDLLKLQEDVVSLYLSGRPKIKNIASLHIPYAFRASKPAPEADPLNNCSVINSFEQDLNQVGKCLPPILKSNLTEGHHVLQLLECEFHSVDYHAMLDVVTGLKTAITLLEKRVKETGSDGTEIHKLTLEAFLCSEEDKHQALEIFGKRLSEHQMSTVMRLPVSNLYHMFTTFIRWVVEGRYNFHMLPYILKAHLDPENIEKLRKIRSLYKKGCEPKELLMEFKLLAEVLDYLESNLMTVGTQVPLVDYLTPMDIFEGHDEFLGLIPKTILIQHYVSLRILLKQLTAETETDLPKPEGEIKRPWCELVTNFTETTAEACENLVDYGFKHGYETDTESVKVETSSCVTSFDLQHEDDLDEYEANVPEAERAKVHYERPSLHETSVNAQQDIHLLTPIDSNQENGAISQAVMVHQSTSSPSHEAFMDAQQRTPLLTPIESKPETGAILPAVIGHHSAMLPPHETSVDAQQQTHQLTPIKSKQETDKQQLLQLARQYHSEAVANFVTSIGYSEYAELFTEYGFSGDALIESTDEELKDLEIKSALARLKIIILFKRELQGLHPLAEHFPADKVIEFLDALNPKEKEQYKKSFSENCIDGEMLLAMEGKNDVMIELGVQRPVHRRIILSQFKTLVEKQGLLIA